MGYLQLKTCLLYTLKGENTKMNKTKIIVVEDNIVYCEYVCNMLSREGYRTVKAYHLSTAKKHLQQATDNDIVVADLRLPDGNMEISTETRFGI